MNAKALETLENNSQCIEGWSNGEYANDLYAFGINLYRHNSGKFYTRESGGDAMAVDTDPEWLSREEAIDWLSKFAQDSCTGYGYTREQAEIMVDGGDPGKGYRKQTEEEKSGPDLY